MTKDVAPPAPPMAVAGLTAYKTEQLAAMIAEHGASLTNEEMAKRLKLPIEAVEVAISTDDMTLMVQSKLAGMLATRAAPLAIFTLVNILSPQETRDEAGSVHTTYTHDARLRLRAAEVVLNKTIVAPAALDAGAGMQKDLNELSADALHTLIDGLESELAKRATPIDAQRQAQDVEAVEPINLNSCLD